MIAIYESMLKQLQREKLKVILVDAPRKMFEGHKIRVATNSNPEWYRELYRNNKHLKRDRVIYNLTQLCNNPDQRGVLADQLREVALTIKAGDTMEDNEIKNDRAEYKRVLVWDTPGQEKVPAILYATTNKRAVVVSKDDEEKFLKGSFSFSVTEWLHYELVSENTTRPMTNAEIFMALHKGAVLRDNEDLNVFNCWDTDWIVHHYQICFAYTGSDDDIWQDLVIHLSHDSLPF